MAEENADENQTTEEESGGLLDTITEVGGDLADACNGLPPPIKKGILKAIGHYGTSLLELGTAKIDGKTAEIQAVTTARATLTQATAEQIAKNAHVPQEFVDAAVYQHYQKIVGKQLTMDVIVRDATKLTAQKASALPPATTTTTTNGEEKQSDETVIDDEFLNEFEQQASTKTTQEMRGMFSALLSQEIMQPGGISIKTMKTLGELTPEIAQLFQTFCSLSVCFSIQGSNTVMGNILFVPAFQKGAGQNSLAAYGLPYSKLTKLSDYGLISTDFNSSMKFEVFVLNKPKGLCLMHQGQDWALNKTDTDEDANTEISGVALSTVGRELFPIVEPITHKAYTDELIEFLKGRNLNLVALKN